jgi:hypothetical protein
MGIADELKEMDEYFATIPDEVGQEFSELPDGRYQAEITESRVEHAKSSGRLQWALTFKIIAPGEFAGRYKWKTSGLDNEERLEFVKKDLVRLGSHLEKISELPSVCPDFIGAVVEIGLKTKTGKDGNEYQNVFINGLILAPEDQDKAIAYRDEDPFDPSVY